MIEHVTEEQKPDKPRFYPKKNEMFDGARYLREHSLELNYDFDTVNGKPVLIISKKTE